MANSPDKYSMVLATVGLGQVEASVVELSRILEADGARAQASQVRRAYFDLLDELRQIADRTAKNATANIRSAEVSSRVRPDTGGGGGPRLGDYVGVSDPLPGVEGSVGINDEEVLYDHVPWWWTNEEGYEGHIGREIRGLFQPGSSRPSPALSGTHPLFRPGRGGKGVIQQPIPAREFVKDGAQQTEAKWHQEVQAAKRRFMTRCEAATRAAPRPKGRPGGRRRP